MKQALAVKPDLPEAYNLRGLIYASWATRRLADESFRRALQLNPRDADTMHNYGWYLCQQRRYPEADARFQQALAQPQYRERDAHAAGAGRVPGARGPDGTGRAHADALVRTRPGNPATAVNLTEVLYRRGEYERARFYIRRVNQQPETVQRADLVAGRAHRAQARQQGGVANFGKQLRDRFPKAPETLAYERGALR